METKARRLWKLAIGLAACAGLGLLLLVMQGTIGGRKVAPGTVPLPAQGEAGGPPPALARVERRWVEDVLEWPGTVRSRTVARVAPRILARILEVRVSSGDRVKAGDVLAVLDAREARARAEQAKAALASAEAQAAQAEADWTRISGLFEKHAATPQDRDAALARTRAAAGQVELARSALAEAEVMLAETVVRAPFDGAVAERLADPGDMASPGKPIAVIHDPTRLRLEATVPETCAAKATIGREVDVRVDALPRPLRARIDEISPAADPATRTFVIKAALPPDPALRPGIFGRFEEACGRHEALLVPAAAVARAGQLETVRVLEDDGPRPRHVRTGKRYGEEVEIVAGLAEGERVVLPSAEVQK